MLTLETMALARAKTMPNPPTVVPFFASPSVAVNAPKAPTPLALIAAISAHAIVTPGSPKSETTVV
jgi:hypothetical protein